VEKSFAKHLSQKMAHKMLIKLAPKADFSPMVYKQLLCAKIPKAQKDTDDLPVFFRFWDLFA